MDACAKEIGVGQRAQDFHVTLLDGSSFTLSAQTGKAVLIDFWDVRCAPSRREMPNLKEIFRDFRDRGLEIVGIGLDTDRKLLEDYLTEAALPWKIACSLDGWSDSTAKLYKNTELTRLTCELSERIENLTSETHGKLKSSIGKPMGLTMWSRWRRTSRPGPAVRTP